MQHHTVFICLIISLISVFLNGSIHNDDLNDDNFSLYKLIQRRVSSSFVVTQNVFQNQVLKAHNKYRSLHCVPPVSLDPDMNHDAQNYAEQLAAANKFVHSNLPGYGENLYMTISTNDIDIFAGTKATDSWYSENKDYDYNKPQYSDRTGHFTQVVWKESKKIGVGYAIGTHNSQNIIYVVVLYSPAGNVDDYFSENVFPAKC